MLFGNSFRIISGSIEFQSCHIAPAPAQLLQESKSIGVHMGSQTIVTETRAVHQCDPQKTFSFPVPSRAPPRALRNETSSPPSGSWSNFLSGRIVSGRSTSTRLLFRFTASSCRPRSLVFLPPPLPVPPGSFLFEGTRDRASAFESDSMPPGCLAAGEFS